MTDNIVFKFELLKSFLKKYYISFKEDYLLKYDTYFKRGGYAKLYILPQSIKEFKKVVGILKEEGISYKIIGCSSNIFFLEGVLYGVLINTRFLNALKVDDNFVYVEAGYSLQDFVRVMLTYSVKGFEGLEGIPGTIGGAIFMNAGAYGYSISDNLKEVYCLDQHGNEVVFSKNECDFGYRQSIFRKSNYIILGAKFYLEKGNRKVISDNIEKFHIARHSYQEFTFPNLGSMISIASSGLYEFIFKRESKYYFYYYILKLIFRNSIAKFIKRKSPDRIAFNRLLNKYLKENRKIDFKYCFSKKGANILINTGEFKDVELIKYIDLINETIGSSFPIENEIVLEPILSVEKLYESELNMIKEIVRKWKF